MKQFILRSLVVLIAAIIFVVVVFVLLQFYLGSSPKDVVNTISGDKSAETTEVVNDTPPPEGSIPLNTLPLSDAQKGALETIGVDPDTFVITPEMIDCGRETLGSARIDEIIAGAAPSITESLQLVKCTK